MKVALFKILIACSILINTVIQVDAKEYLFRKFDAQYSLHDNIVRNVVELPDGKICIQTLTMLNIFDGSSIESYEYDLSKIPYAEYNAMNGIYCDSRSNVWLKNRDNIWAFDLEKEKFIYNIDSLAKETIREKCQVDNIFIINQDNYIIYDKDSRTLHYFNDFTKKQFKVALPDVMGDPLVITQSDDDYWILCRNGKLSQLSRKTECLAYIEQNIFKDKFDSSRSYMVTDKQGKLWIILDRELICYDPKTLSVVSGIDLTLEDSDIYTSITNDGDGSIWVGTSHSSIYVIDSESLDVTHIPNLAVIYGTNFVHNIDIAQLYTDSNDGVWVATDTEGLLYYHKDIIGFDKTHNLTLSKGKMQDINIKCMLNEDDDNILLGTVYGIYRYNPKENSAEEVYTQIKKMLPSGHLGCTGLYRDLEGRIWVGTFMNGAFCIDGDNIEHYYHNDMPSVDESYIESTTNLNSVRTFLQISPGKILVSYYRGLGILDEHSGEVELLDLGDNPKVSIIRGIIQLSESELFIHADNGILIYDLEKKCVQHNDMQFTSCYDAYVDKRGLIWIASIDGLVIWDRQNNQTRKLNKNDGLAGQKIYTIIADENDMIWAATSAGISMIKLQKKWNIEDVMIFNFTEKDGVAEASFFYRSATRGGDNRLYFGSTGGFAVIDPSILDQQISFDGNLTVKTHLKDKNGKEIQKDNIYIPVAKASEVSHITLKHDISSITFDFTIPNLINPSHKKFCYKLENYDLEWTTIDCESADSKVRYSYLHPGEYTLKVKSACNGNWWGDKIVTIEITVLPPWWMSRVAIAIYLLIIVILLHFTINLFIKRRYTRVLKQQEIEKQRIKEEMEAAKHSFFVNVSHELRTPLSLILLPLEFLISKVDNNDQIFKPQLLTMQRNARSLKDLVDNLLNFKKLDMNCESLNPSMDDMCQFLYTTFISFSDAAKAKGLNFSFESNEDHIYMSFDKTMMQKTINNLLINALKFTSGGGSITIFVKKVENQDRRPMVEIVVSDSGDGIPQKDIEHIFDRFYQASNNHLSGSGIGLNLAKSYIELHGGEISVKSIVNKGTRFTVLIPMDINTASPKEGAVKNLEEQTDDVDNSHAVGKERYKILGVEDNDDLREYLLAEFSRDFDVSIAKNGEQGIELARSILPDIIISDIMMPLKDGFELTKILKSDIETSHIPIILLTAHSSDQSRLTGYEAGADAFISKPFNLGILHARVNNLIEERNKRSKRFTDDKYDEIELLELAPLDKRFVLKAIESIERNIDNTEYSVDIMSEDLSMNRMSVYRKFKSIMEQTPAEFIRNIRLKRAAQWMEQGDRSGYLLIEMASKFGFNTPKYFSMHFKKMYSEPPLIYASRFKNK